MALELGQHSTFYFRDAIKNLMRQGAFLRHFLLALNISCRTLSPGVDDMANARSNEYT